MIGKIICLFAIPMLIVACSGSAESSDFVKEEVLNPGITDSILIDNPMPDTVPEPIEYATTDTVQRAAVVNARVYHDDEIEEDIAEGQWYGLFSDQEYFLEKVDISADRVHDPISDEDESEMTGWEITHSGEADPVLLIGGVDLVETQLESADLPVNIFPGDTVTFIYDEQEYTLFATGNNVIDEATRQIWTYSNYRLFLETEKNGAVITQQLVWFDFFDEAMVSIIFCGDLDNDLFPDLILDNCYKYNSSNPTLYLSGEAAEFELLDIVGWRKSVGC